MKLFFTKKNAVNLKVVISFIIAFCSIKTKAQECLLAKPVKVTISNIQSCSATLNWKKVNGAAYYKVAFKKQNAATWSEKINVGLDTSYTFNELDASTLYSFKVGSFCSNNKTAGYKIINDSTSSCSVPVATVIRQIGPASISIEWSACPSSFNKIRYKKSTANNWTTITTSDKQNITISDLSIEAYYLFQIICCG